jgi:hypothetical protein
VGSLAGTADVGLVDSEMSTGEKIIGNGVDCYLNSTLTRRMTKQKVPRLDCCCSPNPVTFHFELSMIVCMYADASYIKSNTSKQ